MARPHIEFVNVLNVPEREVTDGAFAGAFRRTLSEDDESGAYTAVVSLPPGWKADLNDSPRPFEVFGLDGAFTLAGQILGPGDYAYAGTDNADRVLSAAAPALVLVMLEEEREPAGPTKPIEVIDSNRMSWEQHEFTDADPGVLNKILRIDPETGDWTWLSGAVRGRREGREEIHSAVEESLCLRGDCLLGKRGGMGPGDYFWRPGRIPHGPLTSINGNLIFNRSKGGGMDLKQFEVPGGQGMIDTYLAREPFFNVRGVLHDFGK
jgi:hypothetical protein